MRVTPGTGVQRLCFNLHAHDSRGMEVVVPCFIESAPVIKKVEELLVPGRGIVVDGEETQREVVKNDRTKWIAREVRVLGCEVPNRSAQAPVAQEEGAPV